MGRQSKRKRRGWCGRRKKPTGAVSKGVGSSASFRKIQGTSLPQPSESADGRATGYRLIDLASLQMYLVSVLGVICRRCHSSNLVISENDYQRRGLMSVLRLKCLDCRRFGKEFQTSPIRPTGGLGTSWDVNRRVAFASLLIGESRSSIEQFCSVLGMPPPPTDKPWRLHLKHIGETLQQTAEESMQV